jgi:hypothetical protein
MLSYETDAMTRDDIVNSTYESAKLLNDFKLKHNMISKETHEDVKQKIAASQDYIAQIDVLMELPESEREAALAAIKKEIEEVSEYSICGENELKWEVKDHYADFFSLTMVGMELLLKEIKVNLRNQFSPSLRAQIKLEGE